MRNLPIDSNRVTLLFAGSIMPKPLFKDGVRVEGRQDTDDAGVPLWIVDALVPGEDGQRAEVVGVTVPCAYQPTLAQFSPVRFEGLTASVYVKKGTGQVAQSWFAAGIAPESQA